MGLLTLQQQEWLNRTLPDDWVPQLPWVWLDRETREVACGALSAEGKLVIYFGWAPRPQRKAA